MKTIHREIVSAIIISQDHKILFVKKNPDKGGVYLDCWHIPGGGVEKDELKLDALAREIKEEVGLEIKQATIEPLNFPNTGSSQKTFSDNDTVNCEMTFFVYLIKFNLPSNQIKPQLNDELTEYIWARVDRLGQYKHTPPSIKTFTHLGWL